MIYIHSKRYSQIKLFVYIINKIRSRKINIAGRKRLNNLHSIACNSWMQSCLYSVTNFISMTTSICPSQNFFYFIIIYQFILASTITNIKHNITKYKKMTPCILKFKIRSTCTFIVVKFKCKIWCIPKQSKDATILLIDKIVRLRYRNRTHIQNCSQKSAFWEQCSLQWMKVTRMEFIIRQFRLIKLQQLILHPTRIMSHDIKLQRHMLSEKTKIELLFFRKSILQVKWGVAPYNNAEI